MSPDQIWNPQVVLFNKRTACQEWELAEVEANGNVWLSRRFSATLNSPLNLRQFPFDTQTLPITLISFLCDDPVRFALNSSETGRDPDFEISGWSFGPGVPTVNEYVAHLGDSTVVCPRFDYRFEASRRFGFYGWKVVAPLILIVMMSWSVFWIDPTQVIQLGVATTSVLTMIAWLFTLSRFLPTIDYLTRIDYLVFAALLLVFLTLVEAVAACYLAGRDKVAQARRLDRWCRIVFPALFATTVLVFWWPHI